MSETGITVEKCSPYIGAEIGGVDLTARCQTAKWIRSLSGAKRARGGVFPRQNEPRRPDRFVRCPGEPRSCRRQEHGSKPVDGYPGCENSISDENSARISGEAWHTDQSCAEIPPKYSVLYQEIILRMAAATRCFFRCQSV